MAEKQTQNTFYDKKNCASIATEYYLGNAHKIKSAATTAVQAIFFLTVQIKYKT